MSKRARLSFLTIVLLLLGLIALFFARCTGTIESQKTNTAGTAQAGSRAAFPHGS
jgi:hypothetical protein